MVAQKIKTVRAPLIINAREHIQNFSGYFV